MNSLLQSQLLQVTVFWIPPTILPVGCLFITFFFKLLFWMPLLSYFVANDSLFNHMT
ncbi:hypothetical protein AB205_0067220 [Aquarana catesbeiana]|uniref:Uncharacterized protein n=1 Tax=Aquarana catesbeiana TaxID=8400 RepID=A0A2G9RHL5_AQUCT|nr:hypothetical protein AB205_0067220 [Aquarana catesbeiana]